jgi:hypothetical protein
VKSGGLRRMGWEMGIRKGKKDPRRLRVEHMLYIQAIQSCSTWYRVELQPLLANNQENVIPPRLPHKQTWIVAGAVLAL